MRITPCSYIRTIREKTLLCNLRKGGAAILQDAGEVIDSIICNNSHDEAVDCVTSGRGVSREEASEVVAEIFRCMVEIGVLYDHREMPNFASYGNDMLLGGSKGETWPVASFYQSENLIQELHIDLTDACTERCVHCYVPQGQRDYLPYEICEKFLREFREQQGLTVQLTGGECMMHPDFEKICRLCRELDLNFIVMSNLTLCDEKVLALLKETDPQFVNVSLYSMDEKEHDAVTQISGSWRRTRAAIDALQAAGVAIRLATPLLKANKGAYSGLKQFAEKCCVQLIPNCDILPRCGGDCSNLNYACTPEEVEMVLAGDKAFWDRGYGKNPNIKPEDKVCDIGKLLSINSKGLYYPCSGMHEYVLGDARQVTLTEVWKGEKMKYLRELKNSDFPHCTDCEHRAFCKVCPAFNFNATGSLFKTIPAKCAVSAAKHRVYGGV